jgi:uncharacterized GH25 family protein
MPRVPPLAALALEIVPEASPATVVPGGELPVRVLKEGQPLAGFTLTVPGDVPRSPSVSRAPKGFGPEK